MCCMVYYLNVCDGIHIPEPMFQMDLFCTVSILVASFALSKYMPMCYICKLTCVNKA